MSPFVLQLLLLFTRQQSDKNHLVSVRAKKDKTERTERAALPTELEKQMKIIQLHQIKYVQQSLTINCDYDCTVRY